MWQLTRHLRVTPLTSAVCVSTFLLATPTQNYILTDFWPSHYIVWTAAPWLLLLAWQVLEADGRALRVRSVACGLCAGLVVANAHPGQLLVYATVVAGVVIAHWHEVVARGRWIAVAALIAAAVASPTLAQLVHERLMFAAGLDRDILRESLGHEKATLRHYEALLKMVAGEDVTLEEYARDHIALEVRHMAEVDKMLRKPGDIERFAK